MNDLTYNNNPDAIKTKKFGIEKGFFEKNRVIITAICASTGAFSIGNCIAWSSNVIGIFSPDTFQISLPNMSTNTVSLVFCLFALSAAFSSIIAYKLWRFIGSKYIVLFGSFSLLASWTLLILEWNLLILIGSRILAGIGAGCLQVLVPVYLEDLVPANQRDMIDFIWHIQLISGIIVEYTIVFFDSIQVMSIFSAVVPCFLLCCFTFMPESPRYLCSKGETNAAKNILQKYREIDIDDDIDSDVHLWANRNHFNIPLKTILKDCKNRQLIVSAIGLVSLDQLIGVWMLFSYLSWSMWLQSGILPPNVAKIVLASVLLSAIITMRVFRMKINDKKALICAGILKTICLLALGFCMLYQMVYGSIKDYEYVPFLLFAVFIYLYGVGLYRLGWKYVRVMVPTTHYFTTRSWCTFMYWAILAVMIRLYPRFIQAVGIGWSFWFMAFTSFVFTIFTWLRVPNIDNLNTKYELDDGDVSEGGSDLSKTPTCV